MGLGVNTLLASSSMCNKYKFLLVILDSDLSNRWFVTTKGIPFSRIMFTNKMVVTIKFNFFHFVVNKFFWEASLWEP